MKLFKPNKHFKYIFFRLTFPLNSCLKYMYPPPSSTILANIVNALASVPKFYVQVSLLNILSELIPG